MFASAKQFIKKIFNVCGLEIHKKRPEAIPRLSMRGALHQLSTLGFKPQTVIDVGVAYQTSELYQEFRESDILLIEPLSEFEPFLRHICDRYKAQYVLAAAGESPGFALINVHSDTFGSSFLREVEGSAVDGYPRRVPVVTVDQVCVEKNLKGPYLMKVDVQGAELQVLAGSKRALQETEVLILEVMLFETMLGGPQLYDVVSKMKELGFVAYDFCGFLYRPFDGALSQVDMVYVREQGPFRQSHVYATAEQRKELTGTSGPVASIPEPGNS